MAKPGPKARPIADRFAEKVALGENGCIVWTAADNGAGYGVISISHSRMMLAHRWSYEHHVGPIPKGLHIDHLCRNPRCVNPDHLEAVTQRVNTLRGTAPTAVNANKAQCVQGHPFSDENTAIHGGRRVCRTCKKARSRATYLRHQERLQAEARERYWKKKEQ